MIVDATAARWLAPGIGGCDGDPGARLLSSVRRRGHGVQSLMPGLIGGTELRSHMAARMAANRSRWVNDDARQYQDATITGTVSQDLCPDHAELLPRQLRLVR